MQPHEYISQTRMEEMRHKRITAAGFHLHQVQKQGIQIYNNGNSNSGYLGAIMTGRKHRDALGLLMFYIAIRVVVTLCKMLRSCTYQIHTLLCTYTRGIGMKSF